MSRSLLCWTTVVSATLVLCLGTLTLGEAGFSAADALRALGGSGEPGVVRVVQEWRLPRAMLGVVIGALLALSGALFQVVTRNPLGSPDVLGFSTGAMTGVLLVMSTGGVTVAALTGGALAGGLGASVVVFALAARGGLQGPSVVIVGVAATAMLGAVNTVLIMRSDLFVGRAAGLWAAGSLNGVERTWVTPALVTLLAGALVLAWLRPTLQVYELGDERSGALGARPARTRWLAMLLGVVLISVATAVTGPISFVALAAPQIARRLWRSGTVPLAASAATGALLLCLSDLISMRVLAPTILPTGLVTVSLGGVYLAWLLGRAERSRP